MVALHGISFDPRQISALCRQAGAVRAFLFGSILTNRFSNDSDIDILIETDPQHPVGILTLGGLQMDLTDLLGREVHLTLLGGVPPHERSRLLASARALDAA